jgi:hypothetical protein
MKQLCKEEILSKLKDLIYLASLHERTFEIKLLTQISETIKASELPTFHDQITFLIDRQEYSSKLIDSQK